MHPAITELIIKTACAAPTVICINDKIIFELHRASVRSVWQASGGAPTAQLAATCSACNDASAAESAKDQMHTASVTAKRLRRPGGGDGSAGNNS